MIQRLGASLVKFKSALAGAIERTLTERLSEEANVKDFGAKGDGVTDDTLAINNAIAYAKRQHALGRTISVHMPSGTYRVSTITIYAYTILYGAGRSTILKRIDGGTGDVIYGVNSNNLYGYDGVDAEEFAYNFDLHDFVIDGNVDGVVNKFSQSGTGHGINIWGNRYRMYNIDIINCAECGIKSEYKDQNLDYLAPWFESTIYSLRINNCGKEGWSCNGPHDAAVHDIGIINGSRIGNAMYDGFWAGPKMSGNIGNLHVSNGEDLMGTGYQVRHRYAGNIEGPCRFYGGTTFEGSRDCVRINSSSVQFDDSCTFYIPWGDGYNGTVMVIEGGSAFCIIRGRVSGAGAFRSHTNWGIRLRKKGNDTVSHCDIDVIVDGCQIPISFGDDVNNPDADGGNNRFKVLAFYTGDDFGASFNTYGTPNTAGGSIVDVVLSGNSNARLKSDIQTKIMSLGAGASFRWKYKYPFASSPVITLGISELQATPTNTVWVSAISATSADIYNGSGTSLVVRATATMPYQE